MAFGDKVPSVNVLNALTQAKSGNNNPAYFNGDLYIGNELVTVTGNQINAASGQVSASAVNAGSSGVAGTVNIFPATAARGKTSITAANNTGNTTTTITTAAQAGARTLTVPDAGASAAAFALMETAQSAVIASTQAEIDLQCDVSGQTEVIAAAGALSAVKRISSLALVGAGAVTLAAPNAAMRGMVKIIEMTADNGDVTLALTNIQGGTAATTATFGAVGDTLALVAGATKWTVIGQGGVVLS